MFLILAYLILYSILASQSYKHSLNSLKKKTIYIFHPLGFPYISKTTFVQIKNSSYTICPDISTGITNMN